MEKNMTDPKVYLARLRKDLGILEIRAAKFGSMYAPISLLNEIEDHKKAIELTEAVINGELGEMEWRQSLQPLLVARDPTTKVLQDSLQDFFQVPIHHLNEDTRNMWHKTILYAQYGFLTRIGMSIAVFLVGLLVAGVSSWRIILGNLQPEQLYGPSVSFVGGLGAMFAIIYTGPLKEIRKSVNDLGIASAAFIAYIHRVLEISHTYSFYYLREKISFEEMMKSSKLIEEAMNTTVNLLDTEVVKSLEGIVEQATSTELPNSSDS